MSLPEGMFKSPYCTDSAFGGSDNGSIFLPSSTFHPWQADANFARKIRIVVSGLGTVIDTAARFVLHKRETAVYGTNIIRQLI
jgi:hypothetical protein